MLETSARLLRLLGLLQARGDWSGPQLASELSVSTRTVRKDIERLRRLDYPIEGEPGPAGGYRLGAGTSLPPLLLDDDEGVAVAIGLRMAAGGAVVGIEEASARALAKLEQVLPARLRPRLSALHEATLSLGGTGPPVDPAALDAIAASVRAREELHFEYERLNDDPEPRTVEPQRLVHTRGGWHLVAWDPSRNDWRTFRVDAMRLKRFHGRRFRRRADPDGDIAAYLERTLGQAMWAYRARLRMHAPAEVVVARVPPAVVVEAIDAASCFVNVGSDTPRMLAFWVAMIDADFDASGHPELAEELRALAARYLRAAGG